MYINNIGKLAINCPRKRGNASAPIPPATDINPPILFVTVIYWSIQSMQLAKIGAIPTPMNAVKTLNASTDVSPNIANKVLPTTLKTKLNINVPNGLNLTAAKMARNLMKANDPQNIAVIRAPTRLETFNLHSTAKVARYVPYMTSMPTYRNRNARTRVMMA